MPAINKIILRTPGTTTKKTLVKLNKQPIPGTPSRFSIAVKFWLLAVRWSLQIERGLVRGARDIHRVGGVSIHITPPPVRNLCHTENILVPN